MSGTATHVGARIAPACGTRAAAAHSEASGPREIVVLRALQLGDLLCVVPALRALRGAYPEARITLIGLPWARELVRRFPRYLDAFLEFPGFPGLPERTCDVDAWPRFLKSVRRRRFDLALQLHGSGGLSNPLAMLLGARRVAGFFRAGEYCPDATFFVEWRAGENEIERYLRLLREIGIPAQDPTLEFPVTLADRAEADAVTGGALKSRGYVCIHAGSQLPSRRWYHERFAQVGDALAAAGHAVVLTGTAGEADLVRRVARGMRFPALELAGRTSLGAVGALIDRARLLISNDTGVAHIAVARGTPSVRVSCGGDIGRWAPLDRRRHRVLHHPVDCRPCAHVRCPIGQPCAAGVSTAAVLAAAREQLALPRDVAEQRSPACAPSKS
jgi:ADP-heptose:LPS heptosyltransferase